MDNNTISIEYIYHYNNHQTADYLLQVKEVGSLSLEKALPYNDQITYNSLHKQKFSATNYQNLYHGLAPRTGATPFAKSLENALAKSLKNTSSSFA